MSADKHGVRSKFSIVQNSYLVTKTCSTLVGNLKENGPSPEIGLGLPVEHTGVSTMVLAEFFNSNSNRNIIKEIESLTFS